MSIRFPSFLSRLLHAGFCMMFFTIVQTNMAFGSVQPGLCSRLFVSEATNATLKEDVARLVAIKQLPPKDQPAALLAYGKPGPKSRLLKSAIVLDWMMATYMATQIALGVSADPSTLASVALAIPSAYFAADVVSQVFHKWLDSYGRESNPIYGDLVRDFRKHHEAPLAVTLDSPMDHIATSSLFLAPAFMVAIAANMDPAPAAAAWVTLVSLMHTSDMHRRTHLRDPGRFFSLLQKYRLAVSKSDHVLHHISPNEVNYATVNGWSMPLTTKLQIWQKLDLIWWRAMKQFPNNWIQDPRSIPPKVLAELLENIDRIDPAVFIYAEAYPHRLPPELAKIAPSKSSD